MASGGRFFAIYLSSSSFFVTVFVTGVPAVEYISVGAMSLLTLLLAHGILKPHSTIGRALLQVEKDCPVDFQSKNHTIITSQCKGPQYLPGPCCNALKQFACPYAEQLNDPSNNCASVMFNYINQAGNYPGGLFSNECVDDKEGLICNGTYMQNGQVGGPASIGVRIAYGCRLIVVHMVSILSFLLL